MENSQASPLLLGESARIFMERTVRWVGRLGCHGFWLNTTLKLRCRWKTYHLKMYFLLNMGIYYPVTLVFRGVFFHYQCLKKEHFVKKAVGFCVFQVLLEDVDVIYEKSWSTSNVPWIEELSRRWRWSDADSKRHALHANVARGVSNTMMLNIDFFSYSPLEKRGFSVVIQWYTMIHNIIHFPEVLFHYFLDVSDPFGKLPL